jgi:cell division inhibitor SepF
MAPSILKKTMVYLGLVDDDYDDYDDYDDRSARGGFTSPSTVTRVDPRVPADEPEDRPIAATPTPSSRIRTLPREQAPAPAPASNTAPPMTVRSAGTPSVRPMPFTDTAKVHVVAPSRFGDAKEIADVLKGNRPVIVNLQVADRDLQRRMIDFCSGVTYALSGEMEKVADQVFLLAPTNVKVSEEERQRLQERGFGRT